MEKGVKIRVLLQRANAFGVTGSHDMKAIEKRLNVAKILKAKIYKLTDNR